MKAYMAGIHSDPDVGNQIIFAKNSKEAMKKAQSLDITDYKESYIDVYANRAPEFDGMENATGLEIALEQWRNGWTWYDYQDQPDVETDSEEAFINWYKVHFGAVRG